MAREQVYPIEFNVIKTVLRWFREPAETIRFTLPLTGHSNFSLPALH